MNKISMNLFKKVQNLFNVISFPNKINHKLNNKIKEINMNNLYSSKWEEGYNKIHNSFYNNNCKMINICSRINRNKLNNLLLNFSINNHKKMR